MKVTIITSCYDRVNTIACAIDSVLAQDYSDIEYIVVDGASRDGSSDIIRSYGSKISNFICEPDHGMYEAINKGIRAATGDVIGLVHSDDVLYSRQTVGHIVEAFEKTGADFIYGNGLYVDEIDTGRIVRNWIGGKYSKRKVRLGWLPLHPTCYIRKACFEKYGLYDESYKIAADSDILVRFLYEADLKIDYLDEYIVKMQMGGLSTDSKRRKLMWEEDIRMYKAHGFPPVITKLFKMGRKVPQFISAKLFAGAR